LAAADVEADWLRDTLREVASQLRNPRANREQLDQCASVLERIVADLEPDRGASPTRSAPVQNRSIYFAVSMAAILALGLAYFARRWRR